MDAETGKVLEELLVTRNNCRVLLAAGDGKLKRVMGMMGDYNRHRETALKAITDDKLFLCVALDVINRPGMPLVGRALRKAFRRRVERLVTEVQAEVERAGKT